MLRGLTRDAGPGEVFVQIEENVRGCDVYLVQPTCYVRAQHPTLRARRAPTSAARTDTSPLAKMQPVNDNLMELLLTVGALRRSDAAKITAVVPYYGYARQDRKDRPRTTISAADVARLMETMGVDRVVTVDLHADQIQVGWHTQRSLVRCSKRWERSADRDFSAPDARLRTSPPHLSRSSTSKINRWSTRL